MREEKGGGGRVAVITIEPVTPNNWMHTSISLTSAWKSSMNL